MNIIKKVLIVLMVMCMILSTTYSSIYAATYDQKVEVLIGLSEYIESNYPNIANENLSTSENQAAINDIALQLKRLCDSVGIPVEDMETADADIGWSGVSDNNGLSTLIIRAAENPNLENQTSNPGETEDKKNELANIIRQKKATDIKNMSTADLIALDGLLNQFRTTYPSSWRQTDAEYYDLYFMAMDIRDEIVERERAGDTDIPEDYKTTREEEIEDRQDEMENLNPSGTPGVIGGSSIGSLSPTPDKIIGNAQDFKNAGNATIPIDGNNIKEGSSSLYNILLSIAFFLAVAIGMYLGVKFMLSNAEDKAKVKEALIPYIAGCVVIFGAFAIWKLAITLLSGIN